MKPAAPPTPPGTDARPRPRLRFEALAVSALFLAAACFVTWPTVLDLDGAFPFSVRRFDGYGVVWFGEHAWRVVRGEVSAFHAPEVAWPEGLDLRLADSFLFGLLYLPFRAVFSPVAAYNAFTIAALASTAVAGWWFARRDLGVGSLAAIGAGWIVGFSSLVHSFRLEGEAYLLAGGLLPLFAGAVVRVGRDGRVRDGIVGGALLASLGWSTGYFGINGALLAAVVGPVVWAIHARDATGPTNQRRLVAVVAAAITALVLLLPLMALLGGGGGADAIAARFPDGEDPLRNVAQDSVTLSGILVPFPASAPLRQDRIFYLGLAGLVLAGLALVTRAPRRTAPWAALLGISLVFALGPLLRIDDASNVGMRLPYAWIADVAPQILAYRMPARLLSVTAVALAALAALALEGLRRDGLGRGWRVALLACLAIDGLFFTGAALDPTGAPARVPEGYSALSGRGAVFDLFGADRLLLRYSGRSVFYQVAHGQPVFADFTRGEGRMTSVSRRIAVALVLNDDAEANALFEALAAVGATDLAVHVDSFPTSDRDTVRAGLVRILGDAAPAPADTSGDVVEVFALPAPPAGLDKVSALQVLDATGAL
ncbi:MAG: hypothetical protein V4850_10375 [Myxococcota bacterium]